MANIAPSISQRPRFFHPDFESEVMMVVFSVEGQGFKVDAARLSHHSQFLRDMFSEPPIVNAGTTGPREGTVDNPIIVEGCTAAAFANFLGWLNHNSWAPIVANHTEQLLDILHISHMWDIAPGIQFASTQLLKPEFSLSSAQRLHIAHRYDLLDWIPGAVRGLLLIPLSHYSPADKQYLGFTLYEVIAIAKEAIEAERKRLGVHPPYPKNLDGAPFCEQHNVCTKVWVDRWFLVILKRLHHASDPLPISSIVQALQDVDHKGMNRECKLYIIKWLKTSDHLQKEEGIIQGAIDAIHRMFNGPLV